MLVVPVVAIVTTVGGPPATVLLSLSLLVGGLTPKNLPTGEKSRPATLPAIDTELGEGAVVAAAIGLVTVSTDGCAGVGVDKSVDGAGGATDAVPAAIETNNGDGAAGGAPGFPNGS